MHRSVSQSDDKTAVLEGRKGTKQRHPGRPFSEDRSRYVGITNRNARCRQRVENLDASRRKPFRPTAFPGVSGRLRFPPRLLFRTPADLRLPVLPHQFPDARPVGPPAFPTAKRFVRAGIDPERLFAMATRPRHTVLHRTPESAQIVGRTDPRATGVWLGWKVVELDAALRTLLDRPLPGIAARIGAKPPTRVNRRYRPLAPLADLTQGFWPPEA